MPYAHRLQQRGGGGFRLLIAGVLLLSGCGPIYLHNSKIEASTADAKAQFVKADPAILFTQEREHIKRFSDLRIKAVNDAMLARLKVQNLRYVDSPGKEGPWARLDENSLKRLLDISGFNRNEIGGREFRDFIAKVKNADTTFTFNRAASTAQFRAFETAQRLYKKYGQHDDLKCNLTNGSLTPATPHSDDGESARAFFADAARYCRGAADAATAAEVFAWEDRNGLYAQTVRTLTALEAIAKTRAETAKRMAAELKCAETRYKAAVADSDRSTQTARLWADYARALMTAIDDPATIKREDFKNLDSLIRPDKKPAAAVPAADPCPVEPPPAIPRVATLFAEAVKATFYALNLGTHINIDPDAPQKDLIGEVKEVLKEQADNIVTDAGRLARTKVLDEQLGTLLRNVAENIGGTSPKKDAATLYALELVQVLENVSDFVKASDPTIPPASVLALEAGVQRTKARIAATTHAHEKTLIDLYRRKRRYLENEMAFLANAREGLAEFRAASCQGKATELKDKGTADFADLKARCAPAVRGAARALSAYQAAWVAGSIPANKTDVQIRTENALAAIDHAEIAAASRRDLIAPLFDELAVYGKGGFTADDIIQAVQTLGIGVIARNTR